MPDPPIEPPAPSLEARFAALSAIVRAQHFAWRRAVAEICPGVDPADVTMRMWEITGEVTAAAYRKRLDPDRPLARPIAAAIAWSSQCMGEDAVVEADGSSGRDEAFVRHRACPWLEWHARHGLAAEDRPGCDAWFRSTLAGLARSTGREVRFETLEALPDGATSCLRRIWVE